MDENTQKIFSAIQEKLILLRGHLDYENGKRRLEELAALSEDPVLWNNPGEAKRLMREKRELEKSIGEWESLERSVHDSEALFHMAEEEGDQEVVAEMAQQAGELLQRVEALELQRMLSGELDINNAFLEIHPGAGGTESQDWADMLLRMYLRWCEEHGYKAEISDYQPGDEAGCKSVSVRIEGEYAYGYLKTEGGVHRLVRISPFDSNARRHTSFSSVYVYPEVDETIQVEIDEKDLRIDTFRASGAGGQHVNKTSSAVRITHFPTGIVVQCQNGRSQHRNKDEAMNMLKSRLFQLEMDKRAEESQAVNDAKTDIGWGHQIRSYVLHPYRMVKDLRTGVEKGNADAVLDGDLDDFLRAALARRLGN
ncbi:peptide chain release factor 2, partial [Candidatus Magnetaquicoccus inordinatus]|uniref:peptide chain release factor 2 n=1 Tax=Candidatus Magnetaquicoccus inordinatus TaxID=2496818 RepID=UPI00187D1FF8